MKDLPQLYEIWIYKSGDSGGYKVLDDDEWWDLIKAISNDILYKDNHWHYFYEGYYLLVRCQKRFLKKVYNLLDSKEIEYSDNGNWVDGSDVVESYKDIFQPLFHNFTKMAISGYTDTDRLNLVDRVIHCFMNHQFYNFKDMRDKYGYYSWEAQVISANAIERAIHQGRMWQADLLAKAKMREEKEDGDGDSSSGHSDGGEA